jgi:hypothetical protein
MIGSLGAGAMSLQSAFVSAHFALGGRPCLQENAFIHRGRRVRVKECYAWKGETLRVRGTIVAIQPSDQDLPEYYTALPKESSADARVGETRGETPIGKPPVEARVGEQLPQGTLQNWMERARGLFNFPKDISEDSVQDIRDDPGDIFPLADAERSRGPYESVGNDAAQNAPPLDVVRASRALWKVGWFTWWVQLVLTVIAAVIVLFAFAFPGVNIRSTSSAPGFVCAGIGVMLAIVSLFWTYGYTRLAIKLRRGQPSFVVKSPTRLRAYMRVSLVLSLVGMVVCLVGLQAIVGTLLARLFGSGIATTPYATLQNNPQFQGSVGAVGGASGVQPVDILVIQAAANAMSALMASIISTVWLRGRLRVWLKQSV